ncbi:MAG TPA: Spo0B domain-containing protein [Bacillota bacterium]|nr:Spo0B domain-containing protein [Bacillota bacterium]
MDELLLVLSCKRHELLNHIQVISGYMQLNKPEKAKEYLTKVADQLVTEGKICHCKSEPVAVALLTVQAQTILGGIDLPIEVEANLTSSQVADATLVKIIEAYGAFLQHYSQSTDQLITAGWMLGLQEKPKGYYWQFAIPADYSWRQTFIDQVGQIIEAAGVKELCEVYPGDTGVHLFTPKTDVG